MAFNFFKKKNFPPQASSLTLMAPISGECCPLGSVPDDVCANKILGDGVAIQPLPDEDQLLSPINGTVTLVAETGHAIALTAENGMEFLIHYGLDTVNLSGEGFTPLVTKGQVVSIGDPLLDIDISVMLKNKINPITMIIIINGNPSTPSFHYSSCANKGNDPIITLTGETK